jgi:hypothetical protein
VTKSAAAGAKSPAKGTRRKTRTIAARIARRAKPRTKPSPWGLNLWWIASTSSKAAALRRYATIIHASLYFTFTQLMASVPSWRLSIVLSLYSTFAMSEQCL